MVNNATFLCYCTYKQKPLDTDVVKEEVADAVTTKINTNKNVNEVFTIIEYKLQTLYEKKFLFLEPDLRRETLCLRLSINRIYLSNYFSSQGLSFYQYINNLRVDYAIKLMTDQPDLSIQEVNSSD